MVQAQHAIDHNEAIIYDVAAGYGQIVGNVKHMRWFLLAVAKELVDSHKTWEHLEVPEV